MSNYLKKIFAIMFGAIALSAITSWATMYLGGMELVINSAGTGLSPLFYVIMFGGVGVSLFAQVRAFHMSPTIGAICLAIYAATIGFILTPLIWFSISTMDPASVGIWENPIIQAFVITTLMFGCMALFGYKTVKDLSFLGIFLVFGMIGLFITGLISMIWPLGSTMSLIVSAIGVLVFALFTAYDMQFLKKAYEQTPENQRDQLAVLGALHLYISFVAMFQYILSLLNRR